MLTPTQKLIDEIRDLRAQVAGKEMELCVLLGDREGAERARREMYAQIDARRAAAFAQTELRELPAVLKRQVA